MSTSRSVRPEAAVKAKLVVYWALVGIPLLWGVAHTLSDATRLFR